jgi:DNA invertase Pin-like site-specific DNA recombinase
MLIGYARVSKADGSQSLDLQRDALSTAGVPAERIYEDQASGARDDRPGLESCLRSLRDGDVLVVWKLDRLGRTLTHLVNTVRDLSDRGVGLRVMTGQGAARARGRKGGRKFALTKAQVRLVQVAMANRDTSVATLAAELGVKPVTLYRYVDASGNLRDHGKRVLSA